MHWDFQMWGINKYLHHYHLTADVRLALGPVHMNPGQ